MENASKALIMAGSVLLAILVISMLVYGYRQISDLEQSRADTDEEIQITEYMRRFEQFNRTLYGSELLSLANLQEDYNASDARADVGYDRINIIVEIKDAIVGSKYFTVGRHTIESISSDRDSLENELEAYDQNKRKYNNRSVKYYSQKRMREIAIDFGMNPPTDMLDYDIQYEYLEKNATTADLLEEIQEYTNLTSIYNEFRTGKQFRCRSVNYNEHNGRINAMYFEEM